MIDAFSKAHDNIKDSSIFYGYIKDFEECNAEYRGENGVGKPSNTYSTYEFSFVM